ncbi:MAG: FkbM family methyltransferase [Pseudomonadota bacterium]
MDPRTVKTETRYGAMYVPKADTYIGRSLVQYGEWTQRELAVIGQLIKPGMVVADVGANIGTHTLAMAKMVGAAGQVVAFEPQPFTFRILSTNLLVNGCRNVVAINAGVGSQEAWIDVPELDYEKPTNFGALNIGGRTRSIADVTARMPVPQLKLDDVPVMRDVRLIKIDVEGMEEAVIAGSSNLIERNRPILYVENECPGDTSESLIRVIQDLHYEIYWDIAPLFSESNYNRKKEDIFGKIVCINMLCVPSDRDHRVTNFRQLKDPKEHPRATR